MLAEAENNKLKPSKSSFLRDDNNCTKNFDIEYDNYDKREKASQCSGVGWNKTLFFHNVYDKDMYVLWCSQNR